MMSKFMKNSILISEKLRAKRCESDAGNIIQKSMITECSEEVTSMQLLGCKPLYSRVKEGGFKMVCVFR